MSFTPGPYLFEKQHRGKYLVLAERPNKCPIEVAECFSEPNARLFAAAPELIDNLWKIVLKFHAEVVDGTLNPTKELLALIGEAETLVFRINHGKEGAE